MINKNLFHELYLSRWHDFESNISQGFRDIYNAKDFMDVSLVSEGSALQAHKVVLSACSSVFYDILKVYSKLYSNLCNKIIFLCLSKKMTFSLSHITFICFEDRYIFMIYFTYVSLFMLIRIISTSECWLGYKYDNNNIFPCIHLYLSIINLSLYLDEPTSTPLALYEGS